MARLTLARKIAAITLTMWKKGVSFDPPEITLHSEAGYIFADCSRRNRFFLQLGGGPYIRQLSDTDLIALLFVCADVAAARVFLVGTRHAALVSRQ
jgi:hypothetical protein